MRLRNLLPALAAILAITVFAGCSSKAPVYVPTLQAPRRIAILPFHESETIELITKERRGWWFGSKDIYRDENIGTTAAGELHHLLQRFPYLQMVEMPDVLTYWEDRRAALESAYGKEGYLGLDVQAMMQRVDPIRIGRDLNVDLLVTGKVNEAFLARNRTINWTWATVQFDVQVWDVRAGRSLLTLTIGETGELITPQTLIRSLMEEHLPVFDATFLAAAPTARR